MRALADQLAAVIALMDTDLRELPLAGPARVICATELGFGVDWSFTDPTGHAPHGRVGDDRLGYGEPPAGLTLGQAVAASAAFPPFFAPLRLNVRRWGLTGGRRGSEPESVREAIVADVQLSDGGIYDNLGLERVWADHTSVLIGDGGGVFRAATQRTVLGRLQQTLAIATGGGQSTRLRWLYAEAREAEREEAARRPHVGAPTATASEHATAASARATATDRQPGTDPEEGIRAAALWEIADDVPAGDGGYPRDVVELVNTVRTDLDAFTTGEQQILERQGYLVADRAVHRYAPDLIVTPAPLAPPHHEVADPQVARRILARSHERRLLGRW